MPKPRRTKSIVAALLLSLPTLAAAAPAVPAAGEAPVRGVVRATREANIASDVNARVLRLPYREGDGFAAGAELVAFDCDRLDAELRAAEAEDHVNRLAYDTAQQLDRRRAIGRLEVQSAKAKWEKAGAAADALRFRVRDCRIIAPFDGRVAELKAHAHEIPAPGQPFLRIVDARDLEIDLIVPSTWMAWLRTGTPLTARVDETGRTHAARIVRTAASVDPVSQTIRVTAAFDGPAEGALPGMSLDARFDRPGR